MMRLSGSLELVWAQQGGDHVDRQTHGGGGIGQGDHGLDQSQQAGIEPKGGEQAEPKGAENQISHT
jgi:hypothetical protein